ncbi:MAG: PKD domain-containing protein [Bdellovibrionales bacterium]|nr:PKD domain-containing protein [Bdellovibrionales bacterium]
MMVRRVRFALLSFIAVLGQVVLSGTAKATQAEAATIMHETFKGDAVITRNVTAPKPGAYLLILKNGTVGPHNIEQCDVEDTDEEKNECLSRNLRENVDQDFSRAKEAEIKINGRWVQGITNARSLLIVPVTLKGGTNKIDLQLQGRSSSKLTVSLEPAPQAALPPEAAFLVNRLINPVRTPFTFDAKESFSPNGNSLRYSWNFGDGTIESGKSRVSHSFSKPGTYSVQLTVTDQATRLSSSFSVDVTVLGNDKTKPPKNEKPKPIIQYALDTTNPLHVTFDGTQSTDDGTIVSYSWIIFADHRHDRHHDHRSTFERSGVQFDYTFPRAGSYTVRLTVKDNQGAEAATERVVSTSDMSGLVRDESLFGPKKYYSKKKVVESFTLESPRLAVLKIKNADGLEHPIESCARTPWPEKLSCLFQNSVNRAYIALYRVSQAEVFINGQRVTDRIDKHKAYYETVVSLQTSNTIEIRTKGWPSAFIELELQSLEVNEAPIVYVTHSEPRRGIPQLIEFDASTSVDMNDRIMSYRFQAFKADGAVAIDTDWQAASYAALEFTERGTFTVVVSARDTFGAVGTKSLPITIESNQLPLVTASYVVLSNQAPYQVRVTATASDPDGDALQYNFAYSTGQVSGFQDSPQGLTSFAAAGTYSVDVTARDVNGGTATFTLPITVGGNLLPIANFDFVTDRGGYAPLTVTVDASPPSDPDDATETLRYFWTFGDNSPRVEGKILSHTFINQGQYTVTLSVLDPKRGLSTKSRAAFAWRTTPPNPVLIANPRLGPASLTVDFDASQSTPGASPIASYLFDYADGTFESSLTPFKTHTFTQPGIYNVALIVYDTDGNGNIGGQTIYVFDGKKPSAAIQVVSSDVITPARFELQGSGVSPNPLGTITDYKWTLPNGTVQTGASLVYTTSTNGNFNIQLEVKDSYGYWSDPASIDLSAASGTLPIAQITADKTRIAFGQAVKLSGLNSYTSNGQANLVSYEWTLPNGNKIYGPEKTVTFSASGLKTVSLVVTDSKGYVSSPATIQIQVDARQTPTAVITSSTSGTVIPVTATANGLQSTTPNPGATITGYEWRLQAPDATPPLDIQAFGPEITGTLIWPVNYTLSLRVFDSAGAVSGWVSQAFGPLLNTSPIAVVTPTSVIGNAPTTATLSSIGSTDPDGHNIVNAHWIFSDGGEYWGLIASYYIANPGRYTATVRVLDEYGAWSDPVTIPITLDANLPPIALLTSAQSTTNKFSFTFDASGSFDLDGTVARFDWFFSDGYVSLGAGPVITHAFPSAGTWRAGVNVFDNKGTMATVQVEVTVSANLPPIARFKVLSTDYDTRSMSLSAADSTDDTGIASYSWSFDDGTSATGATVTKSFSESGSHEVTLTVTDLNGLKAIANQIVLIDYQGAPISQAVASLVQGFSTLSVRNDETLTVNALPAEVRFSADRSLISQSLNNEYLWSFGDGETSSDQNPRHRYSKPGLYDVTLTVKDQSGTTSTAALKVSIPDELCLSDENATCFNVIGQNPGLLDPTQPLVITPATAMSFADGSGNAFLTPAASEYGTTEDAIDISAHVTTQEGQLVINIPALLTTLTAPLDTYDLRISVISLPEFSPIHGTIHGIAIAGGAMSIQVDQSIASATVTNTSTGFQITKQPNSTSVQFQKLPKGSYTINLSGASGVAYGNATITSTSELSLHGSLQNSVPNAVINALAEQSAPTIQKMATSSKASAQSVSMATYESDVYGPNVYPFVVLDSTPSNLGIGRTEGVTVRNIGSVNPQTGETAKLSVITDQSKFADTPGHVLSPGETISIGCHAYSDEYMPDYSPERVAEFPGAFARGEALYREYLRLQALTEEYYAAYLALRVPVNIKGAECQAYFQAGAMTEYQACSIELRALEIVSTDYAVAYYYPTAAAVAPALSAYQIYWSNYLGPYYQWRTAQVSSGITYELVAHLKGTKNGNPSIQSINIGSFSPTELKGSWTTPIGNPNSPTFGSKEKLFSFTLPSTAPSDTSVIYELRYNDRGARSFRYKPDSDEIVWNAPLHRAYCAPSNAEPSIQITALGSFPVADTTVVSPPTLLSKVFAVAKSLSIQSQTALSSTCNEEFNNSVDCFKLRNQLVENATTLLSAPGAGSTGLFPMEVDDATTPSKHINPFPSFNPFDPSDTTNYKNWVKDAYGFIVDVEARFNGIELVTSVELSISRGDKRLVVSTKTIDQTISHLEASLRILGINTRSGNLGIARFHIPHSLMVQKLTELDTLSNLAGKTQPFKIEISVKGKRGAADYADQRSLLTKPMWNLKNLKPNSMSMDTYLYGGQISSFGTSNLVDFLSTLATAVDATDSPFKDNPDTTQANDGYGPFRINDGSNPYGGKLHPHETHSNGETLDTITFGGAVLGGDYDYVPKREYDSIE